MRRFIREYWLPILISVAFTAGVAHHVWTIYNLEPHPGEVWILSDKDPWSEAAPNEQVQVIDTKDGWVRYYWLDNGMTGASRGWKFRETFKRK